MRQRLEQLGQLLQQNNRQLRQQLRHADDMQQLQGIERAVAGLRHSQQSLVGVVMQYSRNQRSTMKAPQRSAIALAALGGCDKLEKTQGMVQERIHLQAKRQFSDASVSQPFSQWATQALREQQQINPEHCKDLVSTFALLNQHYRGQRTTDNMSLSTQLGALQ